MRVSVTDAKARLTELVRRAEAGDEVVLTCHGRAAVRRVPVQPIPGAAERRAPIAELRRTAPGKATAGVDAARSQDDLYGADGLPR